MFGRKKDVTLEVRYGFDSITCDTLPVYAKSFPSPNWYKNLKPSGQCPVSHGLEFSTTAKTCPGIVGSFSTGIYMLSPFDIVFYRNKKEDRTIYYVGEGYEKNVDIHNDNQINNVFQGNFLTMKINPGYSLVCNENIKFLMTYPMLENAGVNTGNVTGPDGVVTFKYQNHASIFLHVRTHLDSNDDQITIRKGTPLVKLIPLTERKVVLKYKETPHWKPAMNGYLSGVSTDFILNRLRKFYDKDS